MSSVLLDPPGPLWVAAVALIGPDRRVLVQRRQNTGEHGALWEFPGGKLEEGESPEMAAVRELSEELAITVSAGHLQPVGFASGTARTAAGSRPLVILLFAATVWKGEPQVHAASELSWCDPCDLEKWPMPPLDYPLAKALSKMLASNTI